MMENSIDDGGRMQMHRPKPPFPVPYFAIRSSSLSTEESSGRTIARIVLEFFTEVDGQGRSVAPVSVRQRECRGGEVGRQGKGGGYDG